MTKSCRHKNVIRKRTRCVTGLLSMLFLSGCSSEKHMPYQDGDIIFQTSSSSQSQAIQAATHSRYSHMGILFQQAGYWFVYEAVGPVKSTALKEWIARGSGQHYAVKRLRSPDPLSVAQLRRLKDAGLRFRGKKYDQHFGWSDEKIYCSELVWKMYKSALGIELAKLRTLESFDLSSPAVKAKLKERYGKNAPLQEKAIAPRDIYDSEKLTTIYES